MKAQNKALEEKVAEAELRLKNRMMQGWKDRTVDPDTVEPMSDKELTSRQKERDELKEDLDKMDKISMELDELLEGDEDKEFLGTFKAMLDARNAARRRRWKL